MLLCLDLVLKCSFPDTKFTTCVQPIHKNMYFPSHLQLGF